MDLELLKKEFIELKKEELEYIDKIYKISCSKTLSETEKIEIFRKIRTYQIELNKLLDILRKEVKKRRLVTNDNMNDSFIEFDVDYSFISLINIKDRFDERKMFKDYLGIDKRFLKFRLTFQDLIYSQWGNRLIYPYLLLNKQNLLGKSIYFFNGYHDYSEDILFGECLFGVYVDIRDLYKHEVKEIPTSKMSEFEKDKTIIHLRQHVFNSEIRDLFESELLNCENKTIDECLRKAEKKADELDYLRSPRYREKLLLGRINDLYEKVKGERIAEEVLYDGKFLRMICETYKLPNGKKAHKEKVVKNKGKDAVIVIAITKDGKYIITMQNRINDKKLVEFPSGYIEEGESVEEAAKRELQEETGYISDCLFVVDQAYTSPGIDNSTTYIVIANHCIKAERIKTDGDELVNYGLFSKKELSYFVRNHIMDGAMNKLAYYSLINNTVTENVHNNKSGWKKIKRPREYLDIEL